MDDFDFNKLANPIVDLIGDKIKENNLLREIYENIIDILKEYCDLKEEYYGIIALWIIGTYFHENFPSYPYLYFNAMRGSGKTRLLKLITYLAKDGAMLNSLTEAVLFRTKGTLAIDEFESINRKGMENLRELLNSAYKKGIKVKRMRKSFSKEGEQQVVEEFDVYRPILIANISGMESVLGDRCMTFILEKSSKTYITNLIEIFEYDEHIKNTKNLLQNLGTTVSLVSMSFLLGMYREWNTYIKLNNTNYTNNTIDTNNTNNISASFPYNKLKNEDFNGRELELALPLIFISFVVGNLETTLTSLREILQEKRHEDVMENNDISLYDFISQMHEENKFISIKELVRQFKEFLQTEEEWVNTKWMGRALKRLILIKDDRRKHYGKEVILNIEKAKEKIKMFK